MRRIAIIGSGQAGLLAAHALVQRGYLVTLYSDRTPDQWLNECRPTGTAARFEPALAWERELGIDHWQDRAPAIAGVHLTFCQDPPNRLLTLTAPVPKPGAAIDLRLQSHRWLLDLSAAGAEVVYESVTVDRLDAIAAQNDLTVVAAGRGELWNLFPRHPERSVYDKPQRKLAMVITTGGRLGFDGVPFLPVKFNLFAPWGEAFWVPYFHRDHGPSWCLLFEAKPGQAMDRFDGLRTAEDTLRVAKEVIRDLVPWDHDWAKDMEVADKNAWLTGAVTPTVRSPIGTLPSGRIVTPLGDTAVSLDPIAGQGANSGNKMARNLVDCIAEHGDRPFDAAFLTATFERYWARHGQPTTTFNNLLLEPLSTAGKHVMIAQYGSDGVRADAAQRIANAFAANFEDPARCTSAVSDVTKARALIAEHAGGRWVWPVVKGALGVGREQIRQKLGGQPRHPLLLAGPPG